MATRPVAVAFDVNETLFSLDAVGRRLDAAGAPEGTLERWFTQVLASGFAITAAEGTVAFRDLARATLARMVDGWQRADEVLAGFSELDPHADVGPALQRLADAGVEAATLTNGHAETTRALLDRADLGHLVARCFDVGPAGRWKPDARPYRWCAEQVGVAPDRLALVAVHSWDVHGARAAGLVTGYASRHEGAPVDHFDRADVEADDLVGVVDALLALPVR